MWNAETRFICPARNVQNRKNTNNLFLASGGRAGRALLGGEISGLFEGARPTDLSAVSFPGRQRNTIACHGTVSRMCLLQGQYGEILVVLAELTCSFFLLPTGIPTCGDQGRCLLIGRCCWSAC
jgi:hypothetical protein